MLILYLPFGKLFHIIERPASLGVELYYAVGRRAGHEDLRPLRPTRSAWQMQVEDVKKALNGVGYNFWLPEEGHHWQDYCARCKRVIRATAYTGLTGRAWVNSGGLQQRALRHRRPRPCRKLPADRRRGTRRPHAPAYRRDGGQPSDDTMATSY